MPSAFSSNNQQLIYRQKKPCQSIDVSIFLYFFERNERQKNSFKTLNIRNEKRVEII